MFSKKKSNQPTYTSISSNPIWNIKDHFASSGTEMFSQNIPYWITTNPTIAHHVASIIVKSIQDILDSKPELKESHFYVCECGSGLGRFGFYCIKEINELLKSNELSNIKFTYILTELSKPLLYSWQQNKSLQPFFNNGSLDCAIIDVSKPIKKIFCENSQQTITLKNVDTPLFFVCNYIWDSIPFDGFKLIENQLFETTLAVTDKEPEDKVFNFKNKTLTFKDHPCDELPYKDPILHNYFQSMYNTFSNASFTIPTATLTFLNSIQKESKNGAIFITSDKGFSEKRHFFKDKNPSFVGHQSYFSCSVNFDCIKFYIEAMGGSTIFPRNPDSSMDTFVFSGTSFNLKKAQTYIKEYENGCSTATMVMLRSMIRETKDMSMKNILYNLYLSRFDPDMFSILTENLLEKIKSISHKDIPRLENALNNIETNIFIQENESTQILLTNLGVCQIRLGHTQKALNLFLQAKKVFTPDQILYKNLSICYEKLHNFKLADHYVSLANEISKKTKSKTPPS